MSKVIRVLHVVNLSSFGGIQKLLLELAEEINKNPDYSTDLLSISGVDLFKDRVPNDLKVMHNQDKNVLKKIKNIIKVMNNYDIIHFHGPYTIFQIAGFFVNKKMVYTEHGTMQKSNIKNNLKHFFQKRVVGLSFLKIKVNAVIFISRWLKRDLSFAEKKSVVISNGIKHIKAPLENKKRDEIIITIAGRLIAKKRVNLAIDMMHKLKDHKHIKLQVIGDGVEFNSLEKRAGELLNITVFFLGYRHDAYELISSSDFYLMTTDYEPFGLVVLEAMMGGSIVFCLKDSGGPVEFLGEQFPQLVFDSVDDLAKGVLEYSSNIDLMEKLKLELKEEFVNNFTISTMAKNYLNIYSKCIRNEF